MVLFSKLEGYLAKKCVLHQMCSKNTTRVWKLCLTWIFEAHHYCISSMKNALCIKYALGIQLALKKCALLHFVLKTAFHEIESVSSMKNAFSIKSAQRLQLALVRCVFYTFCVKNYSKNYSKTFKSYLTWKIRSTSNIEYNSLLATGFYSILFKLPFTKF